MANVKVLLLEDVHALGRSGDIVSVKCGYARNFLQPQGFAVIADRNALRMQERLQLARAEQAKRDLEEAEQFKSQIDGQVFSCERKVDPDGHMYGSVAILDIVEIVKEAQGFELDKKFVTLAHPIKKVGIHTIPVNFKEGVEATFTLKVIPEGGVLPEDEPEETVEEVSAEAEEAEAATEEA
ncbi:MAG: 50S ribosomal protein L9 [Waddliaceae bacterium]|nr:50S ribosomal protein L9 [Waddliaceae bacterium]